MWKYKFILTCVMNIATLAKCVQIKAKHKEPVDSQSDIFNKRAEYERSFMISKGYEKWSEIKKENQLEICQTHIGTLFAKKPRSVKSTMTRTINLHYMQSNDNKRKIVIVTATAVQCEIFPRIDTRRFIHFIWSPKIDCLFLVNPLASHSSHFYIAEEICLAKKYNFYTICKWNSYKSSQNKKKRTNYNCPSKDDKVDERKSYEIKHYENYKLKAAEYEKWPALDGGELSQFCHGLVEKSLRIHKHSKFVGRKHGVDLIYNVMKGAQKIPVMKIGALTCETPDKKPNVHYKFIKSATSSCVHLIKQTNSPYNFHYITKQFCEDDTTQDESEENEKSI